MVTRAWSDDKPLGSEFGSILDNRIRELKVDIQERMLQGGHSWDTVAAPLTLTEVGRHAVDAGGAGVGPDIYKADRTTKILAWADALATFLSGYDITGGQNLDRTMLAEDAVPVDEVTTAKGYKHAVEGLRVDESSTPDTLVNVSTGTYYTTIATEAKVFAAATIAIAGAVSGLSANAQRFSLLYIDNAGALQWRNGTEIADPGPPTDVPALGSDETGLALVHVFDDTVNFLRDGSDPNAFLVRDYRPDSFTRYTTGIAQLVQTLPSVGNETTVHATDSITTTGGVVLILAQASFRRNPAGAESVVIGRGGNVVAGAGFTLNDVAGDTPITMFGAEAIAGGAYTYELRTNPTPSATNASIMLIELGITTIG